MVWDIRECAFHGRSLYKLGFCVQCISDCNAEESDDALHQAALRSLTLYRETSCEVQPVETEDDSLSPPNLLAS